tara:strand:+ start:862 stop:1716 length:855 start_codon:yes stop_codon:yes gene_type:complete
MNAIKVLDGAMGTELVRRGVKITLPVWSGDCNLNNRELVFKIHSDYIKAGADIITTNTFRTTSYTYRKAGYSKKNAFERARDSFFYANDLAFKASKGKTIAGSITTIDDCYLPNRFPGKQISGQVYQELMMWFKNTDIDFILFETMGNMEEILIALEQAKSYNYKIWLSIIVRNNKYLLDGTSLLHFFNEVKEYDISCLLINCNCIENTLAFIRSINTYWDGIWGCYPNLGKKELINDYFEIIDEKLFCDNIKSLLSKNPSVIGACCGSTPNHIKLINQILKDK